MDFFHCLGEPDERVQYASDDVTEQSTENEADTPNCFEDSLCEEEEENEKDYNSDDHGGVLSF